MVITNSGELVNMTIERSIRYYKRQQPQGRRGNASLKSTERGAANLTIL